MCCGILKRNYLTFECFYAILFSIIFWNQLLFLSNSYISPLSPRVPFKPLVNLIVPSSLSPLAFSVCSVFYLSSIFHSYFSQFALLSCYFFCFLFNFSCACWISLRIPFYPPLVISIPLWYSLYFWLVSPYFFSFSLFTKNKKNNFYGQILYYCSCVWECSWHLTPPIAFVPVTRNLFSSWCSWDYRKLSYKILLTFIRLGELLPCTNLCPFVSFIKWKF